MIYIDDYSDQPHLFGDSEARLAIMDSVETVKVKIDPAGYSNEQYWLAGCVRPRREGGFEWKSVE